MSCSMARCAHGRVSYAFSGNIAVIYTLILILPLHAVDSLKHVLQV